MKGIVPEQWRAAVVAALGADRVLLLSSQEKSEALRQRIFDDSGKGLGNGNGNGDGSGRGGGGAAGKGEREEQLNQLGFWIEEAQFR